MKIPSHNLLASQHRGARLSTVLLASTPYEIAVTADALTPDELSPTPEVPYDRDGGLVVDGPHDLELHVPSTPTSMVSLAGPDSLWK